MGVNCENDVGMSAKPRAPKQRFERLKISADSRQWTPLRVFNGQVGHVTSM
jgi:hypothetical protein